MVVRQRAVANFYDLPNEIQEHLKLICEWKCNESYGEFDVISDKDKNDWLKEHKPEEYDIADFAVSDFFKSQGVKPGMSAVVVLRSW